MGKSEKKQGSIRKERNGWFQVQEALKEELSRGARDELGMSSVARGG